MDQIQTVADVSEETEHRVIDVILPGTRADKKEQQQDSGKENVDRGVLQGCPQQSLLRRNTEWPPQNAENGCGA